MGACDAPRRCTIRHHTGGLLPLGGEVARHIVRRAEEPLTKGARICTPTSTDTPSSNGGARPGWRFPRRDPLLLEDLLQRERGDQVQHADDHGEAVEVALHDVLAAALSGGAAD